MKKRILKILAYVLGLYIVVCGLLYFFQEKLIFFPQKLDKNYQFEFNEPFEEVSISVDKDIALNGVLFKADSSKGLVFYLHGNGGSIKGWGSVASAYTNLSYDVFMLDYRGYGKSDGSIKSEKQLYKDIQLAYDAMKAKYAEDKIVILGYSIGTGPAAKLASDNNSKLLILQAPYYNLTDMMEQKYPPIIPTFLLKYKFKTDEFLPKCRMPVVIFHGDNDAVIDYSSSLKLKEKFKDSDILITLPGQPHSGITENQAYLNELKKILK